MYPSTEDLLKIRDGELVDARVRSAVDADPALQAEVERLRQTQDALRALPVLAPPPGAWDKIAVASGSGSRSRWHWPLRSAIAASVAVAAIMFLMRSPEAPQTPLPSTTVSEVPVPASGDDITRRLVTPAYASLVAESARLERQLNRIGYQPRLINAGTAATIASLEDEIELIDAQLMYARALEPRQTEALWENRVDLMNALLKVRYAHARRSGF